MKIRDSSPMITAAIAATMITARSAKNSGRKRPDAPSAMARTIHSTLIGGWRWMRTTTGTRP